MLANKDKYSVSAMCSVLQFPRSAFYYEAKCKEDESPLRNTIKEIFLASRRNYGTRKIKAVLKKGSLGKR